MTTYTLEDFFAYCAEQADNEVGCLAIDDNPIVSWIDDRDPSFDEIHVGWDGVVVGIHRSYDWDDGEDVSTEVFDFNFDPRTVLTELMNERSDSSSVWTGNAVLCVFGRPIAPPRPSRSKTTVLDTENGHFYACVAAQNRRFHHTVAIVPTEILIDVDDRGEIFGMFITSARLKQPL